MKTQPLKSATVSQLRSLAKYFGWDEIPGIYCNFLYAEGKQATRQQVIDKLTSIGCIGFTIEDGFVSGVRKARAEVSVVVEATQAVFGKCDSIQEAEDLIAVIEQVDREGVHAGNYGINANEAAYIEHETPQRK